MEGAEEPSMQAVSKKMLFTWDADLNRILLALCAFVWFGFIILRFASEIDLILAAIPIVAGLLVYLFPGIRDFHRHPGFQHRLITAGLSITFAVGGMLDIYLIVKFPSPQTILPGNVTTQLDFEAGISSKITLDICDLDPLYANCFRATSRLSISDQGFTGRRSLAAAVQLLSEKGQVYSINFPIFPPAFVEGVWANVYLPESAVGSTIRLLAKVQGEDDWNFSDYVVREAGWVRVYLDLQNLPNREKNIDEVDVDLLLPVAAEPSQIDVRVDDIEMVYPASQVVLEEAADEVAIDPHIYPALVYDFEDSGDGFDTAPWQLFSLYPKHTLMISENRGFAHTGARLLQLNAELRPDLDDQDYVGIQTSDPSVINPRLIFAWVMVPSSPAAVDNSFRAYLAAFSYAENGDPIRLRSRNTTLEPGKWMLLQVGIPAEVNLPTERRNWTGGITGLYLTLWSDKPYFGSFYIDDIILFTGASGEDT